MKKVLLVVLSVLMCGLGFMNSTFAEESKALDTIKNHNNDADICANNSIAEDLKIAAGCRTEQTAGNSAEVIINVILSVTGIVAVGVMIGGGVFYLISNGDPSKAKRGRDMIIYGLVGLLVTLLASAIVNFVLASVPQ